MRSKHKWRQVCGTHPASAHVTNASASVLHHLKPLMQAYWVLLYVILRPIYWLVIDVRTVLTDWSDPGLTIIYFLTGMYLWCGALPMDCAVFAHALTHARPCTL